MCLTAFRVKSPQIVEMWIISEVLFNAKSVLLNSLTTQKVMMRCFPADESDFESDLYSGFFLLFLIDSM